MAGFMLVDHDWRQTFERASAGAADALSLMCPFVQRSVFERMLRSRSEARPIRLITRFNLVDFCEGVSSTAALRLLLTHNAKVRGVRNLHAKLYLFGTRCAIVTSANLTEAAQSINHEAGFLIDDSSGIRACQMSFESLWARAGDDLTLERLEAWERQIADAQTRGLIGTPTQSLSDEGVDIGLPRSASRTPASTASIPPSAPLAVTDATQSFVKLWGESTNRLAVDYPVIDEVKRAGCHWACTYPKGKRPRQVEDGAVMYMGRLTRDPNDIVIFGRAIARAHVPGRDDATEADIRHPGREWKAHWSHYVRVHHPEFVNGALRNGVSLGAMMDELGADSFVTSQQHARTGAGDPNPRAAYRQQPAVRLTTEGTAWIERELQAAFRRVGMVPAGELAKLDWPHIA